MEKTKLRKIRIGLGNGFAVLLAVVAVFIAIHIYYYNIIIPPLKTAREGHIQKNIGTFFSGITADFNGFYDYISDSLIYRPQDIICCRDSAYSFCRTIAELDTNAVGVMIETRKGIVPGVRGEFWPSYVNGKFRNEAETVPEEKLYPGRTPDKSFWEKGLHTFLQGPVYSKACGCHIMLMSLSAFDIKGTYAVFSIAFDTKGETEKLRKSNPYPDGEFFVIGIDGKLRINSESENDIGIPARDWLQERYGQFMADILDSTLLDRKEHSTYIDYGERYIISWFDEVFDNCYIYSIPGETLICDITDIYYKIVLVAFLAVIVIFIICVANMRRVSGLSARESAIARDLETAAEIQKSMLTGHLGDSKSLDIDTCLIPAKFVGGDLYCCMTRNDKLFFCIGDVAGKGIPAAMYMSKCISLFKNMSRHFESAAAITAAINTEMCTDNSQCMFVSMFTGIIDLTTGEMNYCNAGHEKPLYWSGRENEKPNYVQLVSDNIVLGACDDFPFQEGSITMVPGSVLTQFTDGIDEAMNVSGEQFNKKRLLDSFKANCRYSAKEMDDRIIADVKGFVGKNDQSDDITLVTVRYRGNS